MEIFDKSIARAHGLPPVGESLVARAQGVTFTMRLGESLLGRAKSGARAPSRVRVVGVSRRAIDLGVTLPLGVVRRWNREYAGAAAAVAYSSVMVQVKSPDVSSAVLAEGAELGLLPKDTRARDVSVLISGVTGLLTLIAAVILVVSGLEHRVHVPRGGAGDRAARRDRRSTARAGGRCGGRHARLDAGAGGGGGGARRRRRARGGAGRGRSVADVLRRARKLPDFPFKPASFFDFPWWLYAVGVGFAALFAVLGAFGPARRAARVEPAAALSGS